MSDIYGEDDEDLPRATPSPMTGGGSVLPRPPMPREGGSGVYQPPPPPDASPFYREAVPRHAVTPNERGRADPTPVPINLVTPGDRGGGPVWAFPDDPRKASSMGSVSRVLFPEDVVHAALHDGTNRIPPYLFANRDDPESGWMNQRAKLYRMPPPEWLMRRLHSMARQGVPGAAELYNHGVAVARYLAETP